MKNKELSLKEKFGSLGLVGCCFHSIEDGLFIGWQGRILSSPKEDYYLIQLYDWLNGGPDIRKIVNFDQMKDWLFYKNEEEMRFSAEYGAASKLRKNLSDAK